MSECGVNHAIRHGCAGAQAFNIFEVTSMHLRAGSSQCLSARFGARQAKHLVTRSNEVLNHHRTNETCSTCYEYTHGNPSFIALG
jgi:hypothetical protein